MKPIPAILGLALLMGGLAGVSVFAADEASSGKPAAPPTTAPATQPAKAVNKFCAVQQDNPVDPKATTYVYKGKVIGFCCDDCIDDFKKDPDKYMATLK